MPYVEVHRLDHAYRINLVGIDTGDGPDEVTVTNEAFVDPMIVDLGVRMIGEWETVAGDDGVEFRRAPIVTLG